MRDMTEGALLPHVLNMAGFIAFGMAFQTLYFLIDLYFVSGLGPATIAGVSAGGTVFMLTLALGQVIGVGALALLSQAAGAKDWHSLEIGFGQTMILNFAAAVLVEGLGHLLAAPMMTALTADAESAAQGSAYLHAFLPSLALSYILGGMGTGLRALGVVGPPSMIQILSVVINAVLAPVLIAGWGTGHPLGAIGAGLASSIAAIVGVVALAIMFARVQTKLRWTIGHWRPRREILARILGIGLPSGGEFVIMFVITSFTYGVIARFGAEAQAGFGIASRVMQALFLPSLAISFAMAPVAGQNVGAGRFDRVRRLFWIGTGLQLTFMTLLALAIRIKPEVLFYPFSADGAVIAIGVLYIGYFTLILPASGLTMVCSGLFQGMGRTWPTLVASSARLLTFIGPALVLAHQPDTSLDSIWTLSVASGLVQLAINLAFMARLLPSGVKSTATT